MMLFFRLLWQIPEQIPRKPHPRGLGRMDGVGEKFSILQLHRQRQWEQGPTRLGLCSRLFSGSDNKRFFGIFSPIQAAAT